MTLNQQLWPEASAEEAGSPSLFSSTFASITQRDFAWFFASSFAFFMAIQMQMILFGYLTFDLTGSAKRSGWSLLPLPCLLCSPRRSAA